MYQQLKVSNVAVRKKFDSKSDRGGNEMNLGKCDKCRNVK